MLSNLYDKLPFTPVFSIKEWKAVLEACYRSDCPLSAAFGSQKRLFNGSRDDVNEGWI